MNQLSTAGQPLILFLRRFKWDFACSCFWRDVQATFLRCLGGYGGPFVPGRIVLLPRNLARPRPAAPPGAPIRPARGMSGFWIQQVTLEFVCPCFRRFVQDSSPRFSGKNKKGRLSPRRDDLSAFRPAPHRPAPPPSRAPPRPDSPAVCQGFPGHALHEQSFRNKQATVHWSAARNEERPSSW